MDTLQQAANESFSYGWSVNLKASADALEGSFSLRLSLDASDDASFIEMDPRLISFRKSCTDAASDFDFAPPHSQPIGLLHADQIFSDGFLLPLTFLHSPQAPSQPSAASAPSACSCRLAASGGGGAGRCPLLQRWQRCSRRIVRRCFGGFLRPLCRRLRGTRSAQRGKVGPTSFSSVPSAAASPGRSSAFSAGDLSRHSDLEHSIYEAVLHCKKSIEQKGVDREDRAIRRVEVAGEGRWGKREKEEKIMGVA